MSGPISPFFSPGGGFGITGSRSSGWTFTKAAETAVSEVIATFALSEDATSKLEIRNNTTSAVLVPTIRGTASGSNIPLTLMGYCTTDSGANSAVSIVGANSAGSPLAARDVLHVKNSTTTVFAVTRLGGAVVSGGSTPSLTIGASGTAITQMRVYSQSLDVASVAANTSAEQTFTVTGLTTADKVFVNKPSLSAGLGVVNARVSAADTLALTFMNNTGSAIDPAAETYTITAIRS